MKKRKIFLKVIFIILILLVVGLVINNNSFSWDMNLEQFEGENGNAGRAGNTVTGIVGALINLMSTVGAGVAIIMLVVIGIQYVSKGAEGKAEAKKDLEGYVIGAVILFGVSGLLKLLKMFIDSNLNDVEYK